MKKKIWLKTLVTGILLMTPLIVIISCNPVDGTLKYKIIGLNEDKTDYIIEVIVNKQFIANIIAKNKDNNLDQEVKEKILDKIKNVFPEEYKKGEFNEVIPSVVKIEETRYEVLFPVKKIITNLPDYEKVEKFFIDKYKNKKNEEFEKIEDEIFMPDLSSIKDQADKDDFFEKKYNDKSTDSVKKKDYINFNFMGIKPYMSGKLDDNILKNVLNLEYSSVQDFLNKKFNGKKNGEQIKESITLKKDFELKNFKEKEVDVFFHIKNIQEKKEKTDKYQQKDETKPFDKSKEDKADVYYSLFLKKKLVEENKNSKKIIISDDKKIEKTSYKAIFSGLKKGTQISRIVEVDATKPNNQFKYDIANGETKEKLKNIVNAKLFEMGTKKNNKDNNYNIKRVSTYKAIMTFDIAKVETKKEGSKKWVEKDKSDVIEEGDQVTYKNYKIEYLGLPFENGEAINYEGYNGKTGFIKGFDEQMEGMKIKTQKIITPIFPNDYKEDLLKGELVKFIVKLNDIKRRKKVDSDFLKNNKLKDLNDKEITTINDYKFKIKSIFKARMFNEFGQEYLSKAVAKIPFILVESFYTQVYFQMYARTKKRPDPKKVIAESERRAKANSIILEFFKVNQIQGDNIEEKRNEFIDQIYKKLS